MYVARLALPAFLSEQDILKLSGGLEDFGPSCAVLREQNDDSRPWILESISTDKPSYAEFSGRLELLCKVYGLPPFSLQRKDWHVEGVPDINWLEHSYKQFPPFSIGPFFIYGAHYKGAVPREKMALQIDAAAAFGSGEHATTAGCLQAMLALKAEGVCPWNVLDMGTGSGILAIAAWKLWHTPVLAVDNDEEAVRVAKNHVRANNVPAASSVTCIVGDGFHTAAVQNKKPFDLITANILAGTLIEMAEDLKAVCDEGGYVILSGILKEQVIYVLSVYEALGFEEKKRIDIEDWSTLILYNSAP